MTDSIPTHLERIKHHVASNCLSRSDNDICTVSADLSQFELFFTLGIFDARATSGCAPVRPVTLTN